MKKTKLILALMLSATLALPSCKDDDPKDTPSNTEEEQTEISADDKALDPYGKATEKAMTLYGIVNQVSNVDSLPDDWQTATFAATIGDKDGEYGALTKTVVAESAAQVIARWNSLTGQNLDTTATSGTWSYDGIGTMSLSVGGDNPFATISLQIPQVQLERINFVTAAQLGENASFVPYYEYGDVVKDKDNCYWICIRPANSENGKKHSHWVSLQLTDSNRKTYSANKTREEHVVPTKLGKSVEKLTYFAELISVLLDPYNYTENWFKGGKRKLGLCDLANDKYTKQYIVALANLWDSERIWEKITGTIGKDYFTEAAKDKSLTMFYNGYSSFGVTMTLWTATFSGDNLSYVATNELNWKMANNKFNVNEYINTGKRGSNTSQGPQKAIVVRYKEYTGDPDDKASFATEEVLRTDKVAQAAENSKQFLNRSYYLTGDVVKDTDDNKWICVQGSNHGTAFSYSDYSYFISFDEKAVGKKLENVPSSQKLVAQILFDIEVTLHNLLLNNNERHTKYHTYNNIKNVAGVDLHDIVAVRDTLHKFRKESEAKNVSCDFISAIYNNNGSLSVMRVIGDYTAEQQDGGRDWSWRFYDVYTQNPTRSMTLKDLGDEATINSNNADKWVTLPWVDYSVEPIVRTITQNTGKRTTTENVADLSRFIYQSGRKAHLGTIPANMYREPLVAFAVKRVKDNGLPAQKFEDGTTFSHLSIQTEINEIFQDDWNGFEASSSTYDTYKDTRIYLNDKAGFSFGLSN